MPVTAKVSVTEITGSESFVHLDFADARWVMLAHGVHDFEPDETIEVFIDPRHLMVFDADGRRPSPRRDAGGVRRQTMARIDLDHIRHAYGAEPEVAEATMR